MDQAEHVSNRLSYFNMYESIKHVSDRAFISNIYLSPSVISPDIIYIVYIYCNPLVPGVY